MINFDNQSNLDIDISILEEIKKLLTAAEVEVIIVEQERMKKLNSLHRGKKRETDVLSFPLDSSFTPETIAGFPLGSIVISATSARQKAKELGHTIQDEIALLFIHGILHLLGFDHEKDNGEMREKEQALIEKFNLPKSLIVRTGE